MGANKTQLRAMFSIFSEKGSQEGVVSNLKFS
jgi:hypothetical protein